MYVVVTGYSHHTYEHFFENIVRILSLFYWFVISKFIRKFAKSSRGRLIRGIFVSIIPHDPVQQPLQGDKEIHDQQDALLMDCMYI